MADPDARRTSTAVGRLPFDLPRWAFRPAAVGVGAGWLGGLGMFIDARSTFAPFHDVAGYPLAFVVFAGLFAYLFSPSLRESFYAMVVTFVVGTAVLFAGLLVPFWILPYDPAARRVVVIPLIAQATTIAFTSYPYFLGAGYVSGIALNRAFSLK